MIIGNGQLAQAFSENDSSHIIIFASGVANSNCTDEIEFDRERQLLLSTLEAHGEKKFVYFSSCALSSEAYPKNRYYQHKAQMEQLIKDHSNSYYIFRIPQLFGKLKEHNTIINFFYNKIIQGEEFTVYDQAYRYVIEIGDVVHIVHQYLEVSPANITIDLANPYRYSVIEMIRILETLTQRQSRYRVIEKLDSYDLDLTEVSDFVKKHNLKITFSALYLKEKLANKLKNI